MGGPISAAKEIVGQKWPARKYRKSRRRQRLVPFLPYKELITYLFCFFLVPHIHAEFNELFLTRIAEGLALTSDLTKSKNNADVIKEYGSCFT